MKVHCFVLTVWCFITAAIFGVKGDGSESVTVNVSGTEGENVELRTDIKKQQQDTVVWFHENTRIALINKDHSTSCKYDGPDGRFKDRLDVDYENGFMTIADLRFEDGGRYEEEIIRSKSSGTTLNLNRHSKCDSTKIINKSSITSTDPQDHRTVNLIVVSAAERDEVKIKSVKEGESVTLDPGVTKNQNDLMKWYFSEILIAEITGDLSKICTDVQCNEGTERFRDRLKLDHHTGSLTIMNITNTHSGEYKLQINNSISGKIFNVSVTGSGLSSGSGSGPFPGLVQGIVIGFLLVSVAAAVAVIYYCRRISRKNMGEKQQSSASVDSVDPVDSVAIPVSEMQHLVQTREKTSGHVI